LRHGKGKQYEAAEAMMIVGEWEEGELIKKIYAPEEDEAEEDKEPRMEKVKSLSKLNSIGVYWMARIVVGSQWRMIMWLTR
jgi:hypothetical protein